MRARTPGSWSNPASPSAVSSSRSVARAVAGMIRSIGPRGREEGLDGRVRAGLFVGAAPWAVRRVSAGPCRHVTAAAGAVLAIGAVALTGGPAGRWITGWAMAITVADG